MGPGSPPIPQLDEQSRPPNGRSSGRLVYVALLSPDQKILDKVVRERLDELRTFGQTLMIAMVGNRESAIVHCRYSV
jgi:hypothetical protein